MWHEYPVYGFFPYYVKCLDCGLRASSDYETQEEWEIYRLLDNKVTIDKSEK